jgi:hypothetical protein
LSPEDQEKLHQDSLAGLEATIRDKKAWVEKGNYGQDINGKCEFCGKRQSWEVKSAKLLPLWRSLQGLAAGFLILIVASVFGGKKVDSTVGIFVPVGFALGLIVGVVQLAMVNVGAAKVKEKSKPLIDW